jgi:serine/threonine protein kinase
LESDMSDDRHLDPRQPDPAEAARAEPAAGSPLPPETAARSGLTGADAPSEGPHAAREEVAGERPETASSAGAIASVRAALDSSEGFGVAPHGVAAAGRSEEETPAAPDLASAQPGATPQAPEVATAAPLRERSLSPPGPQSDRYLGCTIDNRYKVEGIVGEGGMGVVYQCRHKIIDKRVALKILRSDLARDPEVTERFLMEAKAASAIQDEHIISISDFGQLPDGAAYFVMEFLDGTPLAQIAGGGMPMPIGRILPIARQLAEGLGAAHQRGIVHRDLKPDNVFLIQRGKETDFVKILDFGIAKVTSTGAGRLTQVGSVFGTPHYMSPEQAAATPLDQRGDIYSLGVMLYELATGRVPFDAENFVGILSQHLYQDPVPPRQAAPAADIPQELESIILRCMSKKPEHRFQTMQQLRDELWQLEKRVRRQPTPSSAPLPVVDPAASVEGTALSTELTLASMRPRHWPLYAAIATPLVIVLVILGVRFDSIKPTPVSHASSSVETVPAGPTPSAARAASPTPRIAAPPPAPPVPAPRRVLIGVAPTTAHVFLEGRDLGQSPVSVDVPPDVQLQVEVRHPDYESQLWVLDGSRDRLSIELEPKAKKHGHKNHGKGKRGAEVAASDPDSAGASGFSGASGVVPSASAGAGGSSAGRSSAATAPRASGKNASRAKAPPAPAKPGTDESIGGQLFVEPWQKP